MLLYSSTLYTLYTIEHTEQSIEQSIGLPIVVTQDAEEITKTRKSLLEYCRQDTLAMVKILERLKEVVKS